MLPSGFLCDSLLIYIYGSKEREGQCTAYLTMVSFFQELLFENMIIANGKSNQKSFQVQYLPTNKVQGKALISSFTPSQQTEEKKD